MRKVMMVVACLCLVAGGASADTTDEIRQKIKNWRAKVAAFKEPARVGLDPNSTKLRIMKASYDGINVTERVQYLVQDDKLEIPVSEEVLLFHAPGKGACSELSVIFMYEGVVTQAVFRTGVVAHIIDGYHLVGDKFGTTYSPEKVLIMIEKTKNRAKAKAKAGNE